MGIYRKTVHVCANGRNDSLCAGIPDTGYTLDCLGSLLFLRLHKIVDLIIQIFDMGVEFVQVGKEFLHHPVLERGHYTV